MNMKDILIIPDVHGRPFWRAAVGDVPDVPVVFLGDYLDPYPQEMIFQDEAWPELQKIVELKRAHPDRVTLLLGNHDLHYILPEIGGGRFDYENAARNRAFFLDNLDLFDLTLQVEAGGRKVLFSHAGILPGWLLENERLIFSGGFSGIAGRLNELLHDGGRQRILLWALSDTSFARGGHNIYGSPVWADVRDHDPDKYALDGVYQVFGHTWMEKEIITPYWACLDCGKVFLLSGDGTITTKEVPA